jgi:hypothetical protein
LTNFGGGECTAVVSATNTEMKWVGGALCWY